MKRLLALAAMVAAAPCLGQDVRQQAATITFPTFTTEQNWGRATTLQFATLVGGQAFAKARGSSAEEFGRLSGELFAPNWGRPDEGSATRWARLAQNSIRASRGGAVEVLNVNDTLVVMRATRPYVAWFGPTKEQYGVTLDEYEASGRAFYGEVARRLGLRYEQRIDGEHLVMTISGRGKNAVLEFPRGTYTATYSPQDAGANSQLVGNWEETLAPNGKMTLAHDGKAFVSSDYALAFDEIVFTNEKNAAGETGCPGPGRYRWTANPANGNLALGRISDDCVNRVTFLTRGPLMRKK